MSILDMALLSDKIDSRGKVDAGGRTKERKPLVELRQKSLTSRKQWQTEASPGLPYHAICAMSLPICSRQKTLSDPDKA